MCFVVGSLFWIHEGSGAGACLQDGDPSKHLILYVLDSVSLQSELRLYTIRLV